MKLWRLLSVMALTALLSTSLIACNAEEDSAEEPATPETPVEAAPSGSLTVYTALEDDQINDYLASWYEQYPDIDIRIVRDSTGIVTAKLLAEKDNPQADLVWGTAASSLLQLDSVGLIEPYEPAGLDRVLDEFKDDQMPPRWVGVDAWMTAIAANTELAQSEGFSIPTSLQDLIKPEYANQVVMPSPAASGTGFLMVSAILQQMGEDEGWKYLDELDKNVVFYSESGSKPARMAGAGEVGVGVSFDYRCVTVKAEGAPIEVVFPSEGSGWDIEANALIKKADIKPEAKLFLDWAISDEAMMGYVESFPVVSVKLDVPVPDGYPADPVAQLIKPNDFEWAAANRDRILEEWTKRYSGKLEE